MSAAQEQVIFDNTARCLGGAPCESHEIANLCHDTISEVGQFAHNRLRSMQHRPHLIAAFWKKAEDVKAA